MWFYSNIDNPAIQEPLKIKKESSQGQMTTSRHVIENLVAMGFTDKKVFKALKETVSIKSSPYLFKLFFLFLQNGDPDRAAEWLFSHMDDPESDHEMTDQSEMPSAYKDNRPGVYELTATITHLGAGVQSGHYVCHVKQPESGKWIYFNDAKVAATTEPPIGKGYMYFFTKIGLHDE